MAAYIDNVQLEQQACSSRRVNIADAGSRLPLSCGHGRIGGAAARCSAGDCRCSSGGDTQAQEDVT